MKKTVSLILAIVLICTTLFSLTGCGTSQEDIDKAVAEATAPLNAKIAELNSEIKDLKANVSALESQKATLIADKNALAEENATLKARNTELEAKIAELEAEVERLKALLDGNTAELVGEIEELEDKIATLESELEVFKAEKSTLTARVAELENKITELEATTIEKDNQIAALNSTISTLTSEKETLILEKNALADEIASLESDNTSLKEENDTLKAENQTLKSENEALRGENAEEKNENDNLKTENSDLKAENEALKKENEELKAENTALRNCLKGIHTYVDCVCITCGQEGKSEPAYIRDGDYIYFGEYPQTLKADSVTITSTTDFRGYYLGSDGAYYAKVIADPDYWQCTFSTGASVTKGTVYYFKVEPIRWRILSEENGVAFILCDSIIANMAYQLDYYSEGGYCYTTANSAPEGTYASNYKYSEVRRWLNATFYETAFSSLQQAIILVTEVDNSGLSTGTSDTFACENTEDKVFLLSFADLTNTAYGFSADRDEFDTAREMFTSDYSRATGAYTVVTSDRPGRGAWWLRSPLGINTDQARASASTGGLDNSTVNEDICGVVPALRIRL